MMIHVHRIVCIGMEAGTEPGHIPESAPVLYSLYFLYKEIQVVLLFDLIGCNGIVKGHQVIDLASCTHDYYTCCSLP